MTAIVNSFESKVEGDFRFDLGKENQIFIVESYDEGLEGIPYDRYFKLDFYHVTQNMKKGIRTEKRLSSVPCSSIEFLKDEANIDVLVECIEFAPGVQIGMSPDSESVDFVEVVFLPCEDSCETYVGDVDYQEKIGNFLRLFYFYFRLLDSKSEFSRFEKPLEPV